MEQLTRKFLKKVGAVSTNVIRDFIHQIDWKDRMIGIRGARGVGKTTLLLQYIRQELPLDSQTLYVSLDDIYFSNNKLVELADRFVKNGGKFLILDEVHRYPTWSVELKNIYDDHPSPTSQHLLVRQLCIFIGLKLISVAVQWCITCPIIFSRISSIVPSISAHFSFGLV